MQGGAVRTARRGRQQALPASNLLGRRLFWGHEKQQPRSGGPGAPGAGTPKGPWTTPPSRIAELLTIKPKWRGWIHTVTAPFALAAGIVLVLLAPTADRKITSAIYALTGVLLFGVSAVYHRGNWSPGVKSSSNGSTTPTSCW